MKSRCLESFVVLATLMLLAIQSDAFGARYVPIEIRRNGVVLLKGNDSDSGERDFDEVWNNLPNRQLEATDEFTKKYVKQDTKEVVLECTNKDAIESDLFIDEAYGGEALPRMLKIHRVKPDQFGREWTLDSAQLKDLFFERTMPRERAAELKKLGRRELVKPADGKKRTVAISVTSGDVVLLDGSDDDDGRRDADAVWDNVPNVRLKASEAFLKDYAKAGGTTVKVDCTLNVSHGGTYRSTAFRLNRVKPDEFGREWILDASDMKDKFEFRKITRDEASQLKNPKRGRWTR